jgi:hypothetical protein
MAMRAPLATLNDTPLKISVGPYDFESELTVMSDMVPSFFDLNAPYYTARKFQYKNGGYPPFLYH